MVARPFARHLGRSRSSLRALKARWGWRLPATLRIPNLVRRVRPPREAPATAATTNPNRVYILPTGAGVGYALILLAMLLGSLNYQNNLALFLTFAMTSAAVVSMHHCWFHLLKLRLAARDGSPVFPAQTARFPVSIEETGGRARAGLQVRDAGDIALAPAGHALVQVCKTAAHRGELALDAVEIETRYPFGLFRAWTRVPLQATVLVYPAPSPRAPAPGRVDVAEHRGSGDLGSGADDFIGPRSYRPGDSPRRVDWKALARQRGLVVKQFGGDRAARVLIDWQQVRASDIEARLSILARQILDAHDQGMSYGLRLPGVDIDHDRGETHKHRCLAALASFSDDG
jgi:uncharacterized protein (DUF58 family)